MSKPTKLGEVISIEMRKHRMTRMNRIVQQYDPGWKPRTDVTTEQLDREESEFCAELDKLKLPPDKARRRCLECNAWNPPMTVMCVDCGKKLFAAMTPEEKQEAVARVRNGRT